MDLMGPVQTVSLGGKKYVFVVVDDFSCFTWFWAEVMNTACHIHNRIITHSGTYVTLYELWKGRKPNVNRAYRVFNDRARVVVETIDVVMNDNEQKYKRLDDDDDFPSKPAIVHELAITDSPTVDTSVNNFDDSSKSTQKEVMADVSEIIPSSHVQKNHPSSFIIGDPSIGITTKKKDKIDYAKMIANICYTSFIEPTLVNETLKDEFWINAMHE
ncbi:gag-pol polyprotein [Cucumis melo var. makuwa]|uniref:Gag-pol polyprotein n=1 Tax=Cucumis melo var. makuwa TaxID=1194695 RepID=A0A5D3DGF1_CUCMM|nr:gag-pol polyprotein [Cucumis melo var. makuwa]